MTARVTILGRHASGVAIGTVRFLDGAIDLGTLSLGQGQATLVTSSLPLGANVIQVQFGGGGDFLASESNLVVEKVKPHRS